MNAALCGYDIIAANYPFANICLNEEGVGVSMWVFNMMIKIY